MRKYEIMYILKADLDDASRNALIGKLNDTLTVENSTVDNVNEWGLRDLAYPINKEIKGYYVVVDATVASPAVVDEFSRIARLNSQVLRHLVRAK
jgi:small subunit ribosomal protein S6